MKRNLIAKIVISFILAGIMLLSGCWPVTPDIDTGNNNQPLQPLEPVGAFDHQTTPHPEISDPPRPMTYEKYFSEERLWAESANAIPYPVEGVVFLTFPYAQYTVLSDSEVIYTLDGHSIYQTSEKGTQSTLIYEGSSEIISWPQSDGTLLFFLEGDMVRRMYLPDGTVDDICVVRNEFNEDGRYEAESNYVISWYEFNPEMYREEAESQGRTLEEFLENPNRTMMGGHLFYSSITKTLIDDWEKYM